ncbi:AAA domain-containing protein [Tribonema minus]|uniref:AAA domain-containing protein n=1 Tax=Tribonema minus TaxID=303371 RepID=A0A836CAU9_9STRA|nr:AAA domain-containing protein [Tribonema minus]
MGRALFVAATRQHVGKTTVSIALINGLKKRFENVGFVKPVGQQHEVVGSAGLRVDKDVTLMKEFFGLKGNYEDMSPVVVPRGYTRDYIDGKICEQGQLDSIHRSFENIQRQNDIVVLEGTGHTGVGSVINLNNAQVAKTLNAEMILVANGGLGSAFDELELNRCMCKEYGVKISGVILNKVVPDKVEMVQEYFTKLLKRWDIPLLGVVPDEPYLGRPSLMDLEKIFKTKLLAGERCRKRPHYNTKDTLMVATGLKLFVDKLGALREAPLIVTHVTRNDIILGFLAHAQRLQQEGHDFNGALVLTGRQDPVIAYIMEMLSAQDLPVLLSKESTFNTMDMIRSYTPKLHKDDQVRLELAVSHYEPYIDFDTLLHR